MHRESVLTLQVAVLAAAGHPRNEILKRVQDAAPDATEQDVRNAHLRLRRMMNP